MGVRKQAAALIEIIIVVTLHADGSCGTKDTDRELIVPDLLLLGFF